jgi:histidyl-tRNA synthetase
LFTFKNNRAVPFLEPAEPSLTKPYKLKASLPRGFADQSAADLKTLSEMVRKVEAVYWRYGFERVETPFIEYTQALGKYLPDSERPNEGVFSFHDDDEQWLSLRYDLTAPLARYVAENFDRLPKPYRSYRFGPVFRNEKPGPGRFRQFLQFDADTVGSASPASDAEMCMMMADTMEALGLKRGEYIIKINNRKILDGVMNDAGLGGDENASKRLSIMRAIDKLDRLGEAGVFLLLREGRKDESGDFTKGVGLEQKVADKIISAIKGSPDLAACSEGVDEINAIVSLCANAGYASDRILIDSSIVRGLEYYTGAVFEAELTFPITNDKGQEVIFGSVAGGGRYDGLVARFRGEAVPATGFSIGVSRLLTALKTRKLIDEQTGPGPVIVCVMEPERMSDYIKFTQSLREAGISAEVYLGEGGLKAQFKYADKRGSPCAIIQGSNEREKGEVQIKDLILGAQMAKTIADNKAWRESRPAQVTVVEAELIRAVKEIFTHHGLAFTQSM